MEWTQMDARNARENPHPKRYTFTREEIAACMRALSDVFDLVRLVEVQSCTQYQLTPEGCFEAKDDRCFAMWNRSERCANCISQRAMRRNERISKVEFSRSELYHMISKYVEVDGEPYVLEMINSMSGDAILDGFGRQEIINSITAHNRRMYIDPLTGAYNRRYYEEQCRSLHKRLALAMLDLDDFKHINDTYGHEAGDEVLRRFRSGAHLHPQHRFTDPLRRRRIPHPAGVHSGGPAPQAAGADSPEGGVPALRRLPGASPDGEHRGHLRAPLRGAAHQRGRPAALPRQGAQELRVHRRPDRLQRLIQEARRNFRGLRPFKRRPAFAPVGAFLRPSRACNSARICYNVSVAPKAQCPLREKEGRAGIRSNLLLEPIRGLGHFYSAGSIPRR